MKTKFYIQVNTKEESKQVQEMLFKLGYLWRGQGAASLITLTRANISVGYYSDEPTKMTWAYNPEPEFEKLTISDLKKMINQKTMKASDLIAGNEYYLKYSGQFCHVYSAEGNLSSKRIPKTPVQFVGIVNSEAGERAIFYNDKECEYIMFAADHIDYILTPDDIKRKEALSKLTTEEIELLGLKEI